MKKICAVLFTLLVVGASFVSAAETKTGNKENFRVGFGIGAPYGVIGGNLEFFPASLVSLFGGFGFTPAGAGWAAGARLYPFGSGQKTVNPRMTVMRGIVAILEKKYWYGGTSTYENIAGNAIGLGFDMIFSSRRSLDFDILFVNYTLPAGATEQGGKTKISLGYGIHF